MWMYIHDSSPFTGLAPEGAFIADIKWIIRAMNTRVAVQATPCRQVRASASAREIAEIAAMAGGFVALLA